MARTKCVQSTCRAFKHETFSFVPSNSGWMSLVTTSPTWKDLPQTITGIDDFMASMACALFVVVSDMIPTRDA